MTVQELLSQYQTQYIPHVISQSRAKCCINKLQAISGNVSDLTHQDLLNYRSKRVAEGVSQSTVNRELAVLGAALRWGRENRLTTAEVRIPRTRELPKTDCPSGKEISRLIQSAPDWKTAAYIKLLVLTGQREDAVLGLKWSQVGKKSIDFAKDGYVMAHRRKGRGNVPISKEIKAVLDELKQRNGETMYVIAKSETERYSSLYPTFREAAQKARLKVTPHMLRHSCATLILENGGTLMDASMMLGHSGIKITERVYVHKNPAWIAKAASGLGKAIGL